MKFNIKHSLRALLFVPVLALAASAVVVPAQGAFAAEDEGLTATGGANAARGTDQRIINLNSTDDSDGLFKTVTNILLYIIGAISVIMIIVGGIRYVISNGDSNQITTAKNTILYAVIGLVVALLAYAIINFVLDQLAAPAP